MSVMLPRLCKAIMSVCRALFIEILCMFSHETPDPSEQSPLRRSTANFMSSPTAASEMLKWGGEKCKFLKSRMAPCHPHLYYPLDFHHRTASASFMCAILCLKVPLLLAKLVHSYKPSLRHTRRSVCVFATYWSQRFGHFCVLYGNFFFVCSDPPVLSKLHRQGTESTYCSHTLKR